MEAAQDFGIFEFSPLLQPLTLASCDIDVARSVSGYLSIESTPSVLLMRIVRPLQVWPGEAAEV